MRPSSVSASSTDAPSSLHVAVLAAPSANEGAAMALQGLVTARLVQVAPNAPPDPAMAGVLVDGLGAQLELRDLVAELQRRWEVPIAVLVGPAEVGVQLPPEVTVVASVPSWRAVQVQGWLRGLAGPTAQRIRAVRRAVNHDLRGPLAVVLGQCEMLEAGIRGDLTHDQARAIDAIRRNAERFDTMLDNLRVELGRFTGME